MNNTLLSPDQCYAKAEALRECAEHLHLDWTDDHLERCAGEKLSDSLMKRSKRWFLLGDKRAKQLGGRG
jgi:hypothetical protein